MNELTALSPDNAYAAALTLQAATFDVEQNPALLSERLRELVTQSRELGLLIPQTSYIVVENSAQWRILEQTEKEKLQGNPEWELMETPEPAVWLLGGLLIVFECIRRRRLRRKG